jgi:hypothetical protein
MVLFNQRGCKEMQRGGREQRETHKLHDLCASSHESWRMGEGVNILAGGNFKGIVSRDNMIILCFFKDLLMKIKQNQSFCSFL